MGPRFDPPRRGQVWNGSTFFSFQCGKYFPQRHSEQTHVVGRIPRKKCLWKGFRAKGFRVKRTSFPGKGLWGIPDRSSGIKKGKVKERKGLGSRAPHRQSAKRRKWLLSEKHYFPMAPRHEIDAFQNSDNSSTIPFRNRGKSCISWKSKNEKCLKSKSCIFLKSLKNNGNSCISRSRNHAES